MLAYVKYDDNFKCILPVHLVKGFAPKGEEDFDPSKKIQAFWISEDRKVEGFYPGFVHALADSLVSMRTKIQSMREPFPRILQAEVPKMGKKKAVPTAKEAKKRKLEASSTLHRHILEDFNTSQNASPSKSRDRAVSELKAALDLSEKALKRERDEKEEAQKEVKRLAEELEEAKAINERLMVALLDKIEIARDEARKLRPDPRGEVIAEFILPPPPGAANGDGPGQDLVGQYPEDDCIIPGYQGPAATSEDREVADQDDDIIPADQLPAEMAEECEVADCKLEFLSGSA
ncbi:uncharacterized protein LOC144143157 [Haemaphysalis longicornis]